MIDVPNYYPKNEDLIWVINHHLFDWKYSVSNLTSHIFACKVQFENYVLYFNLHLVHGAEEEFFVSASCDGYDNLIEIFEILIKLDNNMIYYLDVLRKYFK